MKKILFLLVFAVFACKKQEITSFPTPDCIQFEINGAYTKDCWECLIRVVQYEYKNQDYYLKSYPKSDWSLNNILVNNQCDTICIRTDLDCDFNCGGFQNFFQEAKIIKTVFGD
jgi:hypothetical protein